MAEQDVDQTEEATPHKLEEARKRGRVSKSAELNTLAVLSAGTLALYALSEPMLRGIAKLSQQLLLQGASHPWSPDDTAAWLSSALIAALNVLAPLFISISIVAIVSNLAQTGPVFSAQPLSPDFSRLNPATGLKRMFSLRLLYESVKSVVKFLLLSGVVYLVITHFLPGLFPLSGSDAKAYPFAIINLSRTLLVKLVAAMLLVAMADVMFTRWDFGRQMRMSRRELKDEVKHREGDPRIRARLRELRLEMLKRSRALNNVPKADVLITNPTHLAVALQYQHGQPDAPRLIAKGAGELAMKMRELAYRKRIPVVQNQHLARSLYAQVDYNAHIPETWYPEVARIFVWIALQRKNQVAGA